MCLAIPSRVERIEGLSATIESGGHRREVSLILLGEPVAVGDYLLVQHGRFAYERLDAAQARESLALMAEIVGGHDGADLRAW